MLWFWYRILRPACVSYIVLSTLFFNLMVFWKLSWERLVRRYNWGQNGLFLWLLRTADEATIQAAVLFTFVVYWCCGSWREMSFLWSLVLCFYVAAPFHKIWKEALFSLSLGFVNLFQCSASRGTSGTKLCPSMRMATFIVEFLCVPGSCQNSLKYLSNAFESFVPQCCL